MHTTHTSRVYAHGTHTHTCMYTHRGMSRSLKPKQLELPLEAAQTNLKHKPAHTQCLVLA